MKKIIAAALTLAIVTPAMAGSLQPLPRRPEVKMNKFQMGCATQALAQDFDDVYKDSDDPGNIKMNRFLDKTSRDGTCRSFKMMHVVQLYHLTGSMACVNDDDILYRDTNPCYWVPVESLSVNLPG